MPDRRPYHHGNLREALIDSTLTLIEQSGPNAFSLAEAARMAGVSPAAPYRHFKGRDDLLQEVARRGYVKFADALEKGVRDGGARPIDALAHAGSSYLTFAAEQPGYYVAMFESGVDTTASVELFDASERALSILIDAAQALIDVSPPGDRPPARLVALHIWAMSHGVVELFARTGDTVRAPFSPGDILGSGVLIYLRGLDLLPS